MKIEKVIEIYRPNFGLLGFYLLVQIWFTVTTLAVWVLYKEEIFTKEETYIAVRIFMVNGWLVIAFVLSMIGEMLASMFQWIKARRKNKDPNLKMLNAIIKEVNRK